MTDDTDLTNVPEATSVPKKRTGFPVVWVVPVVAALVGLGIVVQRYLSEGPTITIAFRTAEGIEAGKTFVKYRDVNIGQVTKVRLTDDFARILVTAKIEKEAKPLLVEDASFWIEHPRVSLSGISGISTLLAGNYIGFEPGKSGKERLDFQGLETPPIITGGQPGREFALRAETIGSVGIGSPLYYRRLNVGQVIGYDLAGNGRSVEIKVFVYAPYDRYVTTNTRFWNASGIDMSVGADGLSVRTESLVSVLVGGIAFEVPDYMTAGEPAAANTVFTLHSDRTTGLARRQAEVSRFTLFFDETVRGLPVGAPVTLLGLQVGEVTEVGLELDPSTRALRPRVEIVTYPDRLFQRLQKPAASAMKSMNREERHASMQRLVDRGMRAQLRTGNLLSGQLFVALEYFPDAPPAKIDWTREPPQLPAVPGKMVDLETKFSSILAKLDKVPVEEIGNDVKKAVESLDQTLRSATRTLNRVEGETLPEAKKTLEELRRAISAAERLLGNADNTFLGPDAPGQQELRDALKEIARAAREIRVLSEYLERNPEALIRGKNKENP